MSILKSIGQAVKNVVTFKAAKYSGPLKVKMGTLPIGPGGIGGAARAITTGIKDVAVATLAATGITAFVAGGGLQLLPPLFRAEKKVVKKVVDSTKNQSPTGGSPPMNFEYDPTLVKQSSVGYTEYGEAAGLALGAGGIGYGVGKAIDYFKSDNKTSDSGLLGEPIPNAPVGTSDAGTPAIGSPSTSPSPMQTQELGKTASGKRRKTHREARRQTISQSVRVNIMNSNSAHRTNKYIREAIYA